MSNYFVKAKRPKGRKWEKAEMLDDFYGSHQYAVRFEDGATYPETACKIGEPIDFVPYFIKEYKGLLDELKDK